MKNCKTIISIIAISFLLSSCFIFKKKEKYGCPSDGRNIGAEKLLSGDPKIAKKASRAKYRGGKKSY